MNSGLSPATVAGIRQVLASFPPVESAVLYGSRAKGNFKPGSDIDLTLFGPDINGDVLADIANALDDLLLPLVIDLSVYSMLDNQELIDHIDRVGVVFYDKT